MLSRFGAWSAVALVGALVLVGCGKETKNQTNPPTVTAVNVTYAVPSAGPATASPAPGAATTGPATSAATQPAGGAQTVNLDLEDIKFSKDAITIPANTDVTFHLTNTGTTPHDFSIDKLNISTGDIAAGASTDVKINAPAGTYTYYCNVPGHEAAGMKGTLTVSASAAVQASPASSSPAAASTPAAESSPATSASPAAAVAAEASPAVAAASPTAAAVVVPAEASPAASAAVAPASPAAASPLASPVAGSPVVSPVAASPVASPVASGGLSIQLEDIKFSTNTLTIPANTDVTLHITNTGVSVHNFSIDALKINVGNVAAGASVDLKINAPAGTYAYYCNIPGHATIGMKGTLTVK